MIQSNQSKADSITKIISLIELLAGAKDASYCQARKTRNLSMQRTRCIRFVFHPSLIVAMLGLANLASAASIGIPTFTGYDATNTVNLSAAGTLDWELYGKQGGPTQTPSESKSGGTSITMLPPVITSPNAADNSGQSRSSATFSWTNGTPDASGTAIDPYDNGFNFFSTSTANYYDSYETVTIVPGDTSLHTVHLYGYLSGNNLSGITGFQFSNSLAGASSVVTTFTSSLGGNWDYSVTFQADNPADVFTVVFTFQKTGNNGIAKRMGIQAAAITGAPPVQHLFAHGLFQNNMVLQRDINAPVWGYALAGAVVTLKLDGATVATAVTDSNGKWLARIGSHPNDGGVSHTLVISSPGEISITLSNVVFGDVYIAAGQSNMARTMYNFRTDPVIAAETANANYPLIRQVTVSETTSLVPLQDPALAQGWTPCSPSTVGGFSATAFFFAKNMYLQTNVPVGLLFSAWGAKKIERFLAPEGVAAIPELAGEGQYVTTYGVYSDVNGFYDLYNAMIAPLIPYGVKGAIWYQGEWNSGDGDLYHLNMRALIAGWRKNWGQGNFPFYYVQLPNYADGGYPGIREAQLHTLSETNVGMAVTIDTGDGQLHPADKPDVGYRLAQWALAKDDGLNIPYSGPLISGVTNEGGQLRISFDHVDGGLMAGYKFTNNPVVPVPGAPLDDFAVAGADKVFVAATATIAGNTVVVSNAAVTAPVYAR